MLKKQLNTWILPIFVAASLIGCGEQDSSDAPTNTKANPPPNAATNAPSDSEAESAVRAMVEEESGGRMQVQSYQKTDGQTNEAFGIRGYTLHFAVEVVVTQPCYMPGSLFVAYPPERFGGTNMNVGDRFRAVGKVGFERRESGWKRLSTGRASVEGQIQRAADATR